MVISWSPTTLKEALEIRKNEIVVPYAGGTDYMIRRNESDHLLFLNQVKELNEIWEDENNVYVGPVCNYTKLLNHKLVPEILKKAIGEIAAPGIRNKGTIGGNVCNSSPAGDTLPVLYALDTILKISSTDNYRLVKIEDFITGPKKNILMSNELIESIIIPKKVFNMLYYKKIGTRNAQAISKVSFVGLMNLEEGIVKDIRIALGAVGPKVIRSRDVEIFCIGKTASEVLRQKNVITENYSKLIKPIDDQRSTERYRRKVSLNLINDFINNIR